jgi:lipopolysaccharide transport system ATP-binding protein
MQDVSFTVNPGEAVGIIGINGAGKSTLLKMITGTTQLTTGSVYITGRVAALLELGMGFHPEFTGRQNAFMAGQLLGYSVEDITRLLPEIEAFADIGDYIDQPVRVYSSGMQMRLAFSVATAHRPDVLIVDEALSVGDAYFQHKSFDRIREFGKLGTTLLIVSHDKQAIQSICGRAILLNAGKLAMQGEPEAVMDYYNALLADRQNQTITQQTMQSSGRVQTVSGTGDATVSSVQLFNEQNQPIEVVDVGESVRLQVLILVNKDIPRLVLGYGLKDRLGQTIYGTNTDLRQQALTDVRAKQAYRFDVKFSANLGPGTYSVVIALSSSSTHIENNYEWRDLAFTFNVVNLSKPTFVGSAWLEPSITIERV